MKTVQMLFLLAILVGMISGGANALTYYASGTGPADWAESATWGGTGVPVANDIVYIGHTSYASPATVAVTSTGLEVGHLYVAGVASSIGNLHINGGSLTSSPATRHFYIGTASGAVGTVTHDTGAITGGNGYFDIGWSGTGSYTLSGGTISNFHHEGGLQRRHRHFHDELRLRKSEPTDFAWFGN